MKLIWRYITISTFAGVLLALTGCAQVNTARQWWNVWRSSVSTSSPATLSSSKVTIDLTKIASQHPAWKLAEQLESSPSTDLRLNWAQQNSSIAINSAPLKSTFSASTPEITTVAFSEPEQKLTASAMETLGAQMTQEQQVAWDKWKKNIDQDLQEDRNQIAQAMRVDLNDQIDQTQKNIPKIGAPLTPPAEIQNEMINLRLKLLNNIALSPEDKAATQKRLDQLETQWTQQLRQQAQEGAEKQQYWRETVPRQMRETGEANIRQTINTLEQQDQKTIDLTINRQQQWLEQDNTQNSIYSLTLPLVNAQATRAKSTFRAPLLSAKSIKANFIFIPTPPIKKTQPATASESEARQLKQVAMEAAKRAARQSAALHHWQWVTTKTKPNSTLPDATNIVLREANF
jgi:hypothetical protein